MTNSLFFLPFIIVPLCIITTAVLITYNNIRQVKEQAESRKQAEQERQLETLDAQAEAAAGWNAWGPKCSPPTA